VRPQVRAQGITEDVVIDAAIELSVHEAAMEVCVW
jgi:hypothetical protein